MLFPQEIMLSLQNGSDIRGVAMEGDAPVTLNDDIVAAIGAAFIDWLARKTNKQPMNLKIGIGHDSRLTANKMTNAFLTGVLYAGADAYNCHMASTPAMFMSTVFEETNFDGGIMATASHLPKNRNGFKFFTKDGGLDKKDIKDILLTACNTTVSYSQKTAKDADVMSLYCGHLRKKIIDGVARGSTPLAGLHIVVDAGNGSGGFFASEVLEPLGANIEGSIFLNPDGNFPNHEPNPENKAAMAAIKSATLKSNTDLGLIFDTDVDRASAVLSNGAEASRDRLIALVCALLAREYPHSTIVTDSVTSDRLTTFLEKELGLVHHRFKRGYKNVINEAIRLQKEGVIAPLAIETSGHGAMSENYYLDDGAYLAVKLVTAAAIAKEMGKSLSSLISSMPPAFEEREYRIKITCEDFAAYGDEVLEQFAKKAAQRGMNVVPNSHEGIRISLPIGWLLLRKSLHDPLMALNMEGLGYGDCDQIVRMVKYLLSDFDALDLSVF